MLKAENISKAYGAEVLLDRVSFVINPGERIGLAGRNGAGKTTLLRIITGEESPDEGTVSTPRNYRLAYLRQHLDFTGETVIDEAASAIPAAEDGRDQNYKAEAILGGLGFSPEDLSVKPGKLSGGYQVRLNLAKALLAEPDMLLLDEPTNYLDIVSLRWLKRFLRSWRGELIIITHDREFMDSVTTHTMCIHRKKIRKAEGSTRKLYALIDEAEEVYEKTRMNQDKKRKETEKFIERFRAKATKASAVQSRIKALERDETLEVLEGIKTLDFEFNYSRFNPKKLIEVSNVSFAYPGGETLFEGLDLAVGKHDRVAVVGKNGRGKTTLLNIIAGELVPTSGSVWRSDGLELKYFGQTNVERLDPGKTIEEELLGSHPDLNRGTARRVAGIMLFEGDKALKKVGVLSGGEKARVLLGKLLLSPANIIVLDEPTNHLDMESTDALVEAIEDFKGAVVMVTHSEMILERVATRLVVFDRCRAEVFDGSYREFLEKVGWQGEEDGTGGVNERGRGKESKALIVTEAGEVAVKGAGKRDLRRARAEVVGERSRVLGPLKLRMGGIEDEITGLEETLNRLNSSLLKAYEDNNTVEITALSKVHHEATARIDALFEELERLSSEYEGRNMTFEERLRDLE